MVADRSVEFVGAVHDDSVASAGEIWVSTHSDMTDRTSGSGCVA